MKWIEYHSEEGEIWEVFKTTLDENEDEKDLVSQKNNYAIYRKEMLSVDFIKTSIIPAARIVDDVSGKVGREKEFYIKLELMNEDWFCFSNRTFQKEEVIKLTGYFIGLNKKQAERVWKAKKLGKMNTYRLEI